MIPGAYQDDHNVLTVYQECAALTNELLPNAYACHTAMKRKSDHDCKIK